MLASKAFAVFFLDGDWVESKDQSEQGIRLIQTGNIGVGEYLDKMDKARYINEETFKRLKCTEVLEGDILISRLPDPVGRACIVGNLEERAITAVDCSILRFNPKVFISKLFPYYTKSHYYYRQLKPYLTGASRKRISRTNLESIQIPLPPLEIQKEIVAEIEGYQKVIDGARAVVDNYKPHIAIDPEWPMQSIGQLCTVERGASPRPIKKFVTNSSEGINWVKIGDAKIGSKYITETNEKISKEGAKKSRAVKKGNFILSNSMSFGRPYIMAVDGCIHDGWLLLSRFSDKLNTDFLYYVLGSDFIYKHFEKLATGGVVNNLNSELVRNVKIPLPPINYQRQIASNFEAEQALVDANHELIDRFEKKIQDTIAREWGEDPSTKEERIYNQSDFMKAVKVETISH